MNKDYKNLPKEKIKELLKLSSASEINLFKKKKNNWILRDTRIIVNECNQKKKKKLKNLSNNLKKISSNRYIKTEEVKHINRKTLSDIDDLDNIIKIFNENLQDDFIEIYSN